MRVRLHHASIVDYYLLYFDYIVTIASKLGGNGSAIKNIPPLDELKNLLIPMPPINEQIRILKQIKYVYGLIDLIAGGKKLKKSEAEETKIKDAEKIIRILEKPKTVKFDVNNLGLAARSDSGIDEKTVTSALKQVQNYYDKKN